MSRPFRVLAVLTAATVTATALSIPAEAAAGSLTLTAYDRNGKSVKLDANVVNISSHFSHTVRTGKTKSLTAGRYAVFASVNMNAADGTSLSSTVIGTTVTVRRGTKLTLDARKGKPLGLSMDVDRNQWYQNDYAAICLKNGGLGNGVETWNSGGRVYVVPSTSKDLQSAYYGYWSGGPSKEKLSVFGRATSVPTKLGRAYRKADLAKVSVQVRKGPSIGTDTDIRIEPDTPNGCGLYGSSEREYVPHTLNAYVSPGKWMTTVGTWTPQQWRQSDWSGPWRTYAKGKSYTEVFGRAVWGPRKQLPSVYSGKLSYWPDDLFDDTAKSGSECCSMAAVTLSKGGKKVKSQSITQWGAMRHFETKLPASGWYRLNVDAKRYHPHYKSIRADILSPRATIDWSFYGKKGASARPTVVLTKFEAFKLDMNNRAAVGSTTPVTMRMDARKGAPKLRTVTVEASFDEGRTWKRVSVRQQGSAWEVSVPNGATPGYVALRSTVQDVKGNKSVQTIYRAYGLR